MKKVLLFLILVGILFISACAKIEETECVSDSDCATGGCSGEICTTKDKAENIITTCIFKPEYECLKQTSCKCINKKCQWEETNEYNECMKKLE